MNTTNLQERWPMLTKAGLISVAKPMTDEEIRLFKRNMASRESMRRIRAAKKQKV